MMFTHKLVLPNYDYEESMLMARKLAIHFSKFEHKREGNFIFFNYNNKHDIFLETNGLEHMIEYNL